MLGSNRLMGLSIGSLSPYIIIVIGLLGLSFIQDRITLAIITTFNAMANILMKSRAKDNDFYSNPYSTRSWLFMCLIGSNNLINSVTLPAPGIFCKRPQLLV